MPNEQPSSLKIGLSLSGGGSRAVAFHLGCLRALNDLDILQNVQVLSTVSGGSVIGALYAAKDQPFPEFEKDVRQFLRAGLVVPSIKTAITTDEGLKALLSCFLVFVPNFLLAAIQKFVSITRIRSASAGHAKILNLIQALFPRRFASRTTILMRALDSKFIKGRRLSGLSKNRPFLIINATELRTGSAFYFSSEESGSWRYGKTIGQDFPLAHAVMVSAAYPFFLPAVDWALDFESRSGDQQKSRVILTDGGIYDNLGLAPLWPDRDPSVSLNVQKVDTIICCRAGYGLSQKPPVHFMFARLVSSFSTLHERTQNASLKRLFDLKKAGVLGNIAILFLGQKDNLLQNAPVDLVPRADVEGYPTNFSAMSEDWIDILSRRGEQLTRTIIAEHAPNLLKNNTKKN